MITLMVVHAPADAAEVRHSTMSAKLSIAECCSAIIALCTCWTCKQHCTDTEKEWMSHLAYWMSVKARVMRAVIEVMLLALNGAARTSPSARTRPSTGCTMQAVPQPNISLKRPSAAAWRKSHCQANHWQKAVTIVHPVPHPQSSVSH